MLKKPKKSRALIHKKIHIFEHSLPSICQNKESLKVTPLVLRQELGSFGQLGNFHPIY